MIFPNSSASLRSHFDGNLCTFTHKKIHLDIDPSVPPKCAHPCSAPITQWALFKKELKCHVAIAVFEKCGCADWVAGAFCIPRRMVAFGAQFLSIEQSCQVQVLSTA